MGQSASAARALVCGSTPTVWLRGVAGALALLAYLAAPVVTPRRSECRNDWGLSACRNDGFAGNNLIEGNLVSNWWI